MFGRAWHDCGPRRGHRSWGPFSVEWNFPQDMGRGRGRRRFDGGALRLLLLKLIEEQPRHGYDLIREIEERSGGAYVPSPGVVYPTLTLLQDMGLIQEAEAEGARKPFAITAEGRAYLAERAEEVEALFARLSGMEGRGGARAAPIKRSVANLLAALWHRIGEEGLSEERLHEVAEILDEAARKIERLK